MADRSCINQGKKFMSDNAILIDTNILVHAYNTFDREKHSKCKALVEEGFKGAAEFAVSNQILAELFSVLTRKIGNPLSSEGAGAVVCGIIDSMNWAKFNYNHDTVKRATILSKANNISIWDSLIAETALENGVTKIYTENLKDFKKIPGLKAVNPIEE